jgi:hypothetical protein
MGWCSGHTSGSSLNKAFPRLNKVFSGVPLFLWAKVRLVPSLVHDWFLLNPFKFVIIQPSYTLVVMPHSLSCWQHVSNHNTHSTRTCTVINIKLSRLLDQTWCWRNYSSHKCNIKFGSYNSAVTWRFFFTINMKFLKFLFPSLYNSKSSEGRNIYF